MPLVKFSQIDDASDYSPLPSGKYPCKLVHIEEKVTRKGDEMWAMEFEVESGDYKGRKIFDNIVFSEAAAKRLKLICSRLGVETSQDLHLTTDMILGKRVGIEVGIDEYEDSNGRMKQRNVVPFAGYEVAGSKADEDDNIPF